MDDNETYDPSWRDDLELYSLLLAAKITGLADLDGALGIKAGYWAIVADDLPWRQVAEARGCGTFASARACICAALPHW